MPFLVFDEIEKETVTPKYSTAYGELVTGEFIEVGRLSIQGRRGRRGARPSARAGYVRHLRPAVGGSGWGARRARARHGVPRQAQSQAPVQAVEDTQVISCKHVIEGVGHKI